ncbi:hypothetical protein ACE41H_15605 [Paenibacillus enshidis]|uniref:Uncharacterized protein n=1 Tax=Paenibacillus enshidis TaxID=1458439 RepID=A0ABV5AVG3_9BACL
MKTQEEVENLKENWLNDPCWDISLTEDFEEFAEQLRQREINEAKVDATAEDLGVKGLYRLICRLEDMQEIHSEAIALLTEGKSFEAYNVLLKGLKRETMLKDRKTGAEKP